MSDKLLDKSRTTPLPSDIPRSDLPDRFCDFFFCDKIKRIRDDLDSPLVTHQPWLLLSQFEPVTEKVIRELIIKSPTKRCMLDPIPTSLTKKCLNDQVSLIKVIVNASLSAGVDPQQFKQALVTPLLKKPGLDY